MAQLEAPCGRPMSPLLHCMDQLDMDTLAQVLLPKLMQQGSTHSVALTCSRLRDLCYSSVQELKLKAVPGCMPDAAAVKSWGQSLSAHFPSCQSISVGVGCAADCELTAHMVPALARLPKLDTISLTVESATPRQPARQRPGVVSFLRTMRKHLSNLRNLDVTCKQNWHGASKVWQELGLFTQLTGLDLDFPDEVTSACTGAEVATLGRLTQLQELHLTTAHPPKSQRSQLLSVQLLDKLVSLTSLEVGECISSELQCISHCTSLQSLCFDCNQSMLGAAEWGSVGRLTGLTYLDLGTSQVVSIPCDALGQLKHLAHFAAVALSADILPALAACTRLTEIWGQWRAGSPNVLNTGRVIIPSVLGLSFTGGAVPFSAFPNLRRLDQGRAIDAGAFSNLSLYCSNLEELVQQPVRSPGTDPDGRPFCLFSLTWPMDPVTQLFNRPRFGCWDTLTDPCLEKLSVLEVSVCDDYELLSLSAAAQKLLDLSLTSLHLNLLASATVTAAGLVHLGRIGGLQRLNVHMLDAFSYNGLLRVESDCFMFLHMCGLSGVGHVRISSTQAHKQQALEAAKASLVGSKLPAPASITIDLLPEA